MHFVQKLDTIICAFFAPENRQTLPKDKPQESATRQAKGRDAQNLKLCPKSCLTFDIIRQTTNLLHSLTKMHYAILPHFYQSFYARTLLFQMSTLKTTCFSCENRQKQPCPECAELLAPPPSGQGLHLAPPPSGQGLHLVPPPSGQGLHLAPPPSGQGLHLAPPPSGQGLHLAPPPSGQGSHLAHVEHSRHIHGCQLCNEIIEDMRHTDCHHVPPIFTRAAPPPPGRCTEGACGGCRPPHWRAQ